MLNIVWIRVYLYSSEESTFYQLNWSNLLMPCRIFQNFKCVPLFLVNIILLNNHNSVALSCLRHVFIHIRLEHVWFTLFDIFHANENVFSANKEKLKILIFASFFTQTGCVAGGRGRRVGIKWIQLNWVCFILPAFATQIFFLLKSNENEAW